MLIKNITDNDEKQKIARCILEALPDWFAVEESREKYIEESAQQLFFAAFAGLGYYYPEALKIYGCLLRIVGGKAVNLLRRIFRTR